MKIRNYFRNSIGKQNTDDQSQDSWKDSLKDYLEDSLEDSLNFSCSDDIGQVIERYEKMLSNPENVGINDRELENFPTKSEENKEIDIIQSHPTMPTLSPDNLDEYSDSLIDRYLQDSKFFKSEDFKNLGKVEIAKYRSFPAIIQYL